MTKNQPASSRSSRCHPSLLWCCTMALLSINTNFPLCNALSQLPLTFEKFTFAPNGVCTNPANFVYRPMPLPPRTHNDDDNKYRVVPPPRQPSSAKVFTMRNVPGAGDCMFQAVILASLTSMGLGGNDVLLRAISRETRAVVAQILQSPDGNLIIEGNRLVPARDLLLSAS